MTSGAALADGASDRANREAVNECSLPGSDVASSESVSLIQYLSRIQFDFGALGLLGEELARLRIERPLLVTDAGVAAAGIVERTLAAARPVVPVVYADTTGNPTESCLEQCLALWREHGCDGLIALGGGSPIDLSKAVALIASHGGAFADYDVKTGASEGIGRVAPQIAVPTAAGTGAEIGRACVMTLHTGRKCVAVNLNMVADTVICDPELTLSLPARMTAATGIDALSHGVETYLSTSVNPPADAIAIDCVGRCAKWLRRAVEDGSDREARWQMMMAALEGGMVLQKGLGSAHAMANPLGEAGHHHGTLLGILLPHVVRFNAKAAAPRLADLHARAGVESGRSLAEWLQRLVHDVGLPGRLGDLGVTQAQVDTLAEKASKDHLSRTNPRAASAEDYRRLLRAAL